MLSHLINQQKWDQALIFIEKKHGAAKLVAQLAKRGIEADCIHGDRSQAMREKILADFKSGKLKYLVATGVAARGIDIGELSRVLLITTYPLNQKNISIVLAEQVARVPQVKPYRLLPWGILKIYARLKVV